MRSFTGPSGTAFNYNSDGSGEVFIYPCHAPADAVPVVVPFEDLRSLVADLVRTERISKLEQASDEAILGLPRVVGKRM